MTAPGTQLILINGKVAAAWNGKKEKCGERWGHGCGAAIGWALTANGKWTPFDLDEKFTSHFATCPFSDKFKRSSKKQPEKISR